MSKTKYPISEEFFPYSLFALPIHNAKTAGFLGSLMRPPRWIFRDNEISATKEKISGYGGSEIELLLIEPKNIKEQLPCIVYYHGGGFFFGGTAYHYRLAKEYALKVPCKVVFPLYRLAPKHPFPSPAEDCYAALQWTFSNADRLGVNKDKIGVGGDSAGGALAAAVAQMARDRNAKRPAYQLLVYPVTDRRMQSDSNRRFTDTPMWNSKLSVKMWKGYVQDDTLPNLQYASPAEAESFANLPPAYIETAEFDCLHDEGVAYAEALGKAAVPVELNETKATMHGFDIVEKASLTRAAVDARIRYLKNFR